jgi:hypothetical protein
VCDEGTLQAGATVYYVCQQVVVGLVMNRIRVDSNGGNSSIPRKKVGVTKVLSVQFYLRLGAL